MQAGPARIVVWGRGTDATRRLPEGRFDIADVTAGMIDGDVAGTHGAANPARALAVEELVLATRGVFGDVRVRQAFASCMPREGLARRFGQGARMWNQRLLAPADNLAGQINNDFGRAYQRPDPARARALLDAMWRQVRGERGRDRGREAFNDEMLTHQPFLDFAVSWWPPLAAPEVLGWLRDPEFMAKVAEGVISQEDQRLLAKS